MIVNPTISNVERWTPHDQCSIPCPLASLKNLKKKSIAQTGEDGKVEPSVKITIGTDSTLQ
jgi:hypothetical protein